jgi:membrane-associated phospholipid phosphatase
LHTDRGRALPGATKTGATKKGTAVTELGIVAAISLAAGLACAAAVRTIPQADPARSASKHLEAALVERRGVRRFLLARLDPQVATGFALTVVLLGVIVAGAVFGVLVAMIRAGSGVVNIDLSVSRWAAAQDTSLSLNVLGWITWAGGTVVIVAVACVTAAFAVRRWKRTSVVLFFLLVVGGQFLLSNLIKVAVARVRPDVPPLHVVSGPSFPSGHATAAAATWAAVALVLARGASPRVRAALNGAAVAIAVAVACSRVLLGAHWTSDVVGGLILGWTWFGMCAVAFGGRMLRLGAPADAVTTAPVAVPPRARDPSTR